MDRISAVKSGTLAEAISEIGSDVRTLTISSNESVTADLTVPSNVTLRFEREGQITVSSGKVLTVQGSVETTVKQIFSCDSGGVLSGGNVPVTYSEWFGAVGNGTTDDHTALSCAVTFLNAAGSGTLSLLPGKTYKIGSNLAILATAVLKGEGGILKPADTKTIVVAGDIDCKKKQLFDSSLCVTSGGTAFSKTMDILPEWWGTCSASNNTIQHAIDSAQVGSRIILSNEYEVSSITIERGVAASGLSIVGRGTMPEKGDDGSGLPALYLADSQDDHVINVAGNGSINLRLDNFKINGNRANQGAASHGIYFSGAITDVYVGRLIIEDCYTSGFSVTGGSVCSRFHIDTIIGYNNQGRAVDLDYLQDSYIGSIDADLSGVDGVRLGANGPCEQVRIDKIRTYNSVNNGVLLSGNKNLISMIETDLSGLDGVLIAGDDNVIGIISSNHCNDSGVCVNGDRNKISTLYCIDDWATPIMSYALEFGAPATDNFVGDFSVDGNQTVGSMNAASGAEDNGNSVRQSEAMQSITYAAAITPDPWLGKFLNIGTLTGNIAINNVAAVNKIAGTEMTFRFIQDSTGGRTVSWGGDYLAGFSDDWNVPSTQAAISLVFDGTNWIKKSSVVWAGQQVYDRDDYGTATTTDATVTTVWSKSLSDETAYVFTARTTAQKSDGSDRAVYGRTVLVYRNGGGGATIEGAVVDNFTIESDATWNCTFDVNGNDVRLRVTGKAATTIYWLASVDSEQIAGTV